MSDIKFFPELFLEEPELNRMYNFIVNEGYKKLILKFTEYFGIIKKRSDSNFTALKIYNSSAGKIGIRAGMAFDSNGQFIEVKEDLPDLFTVPDDNTPRKVFIQYLQTQIEQGTIELQANGNIIGTNTKFTEVFKVGKRIEVINSTNGNDGTYGITSVTDDTHLTVDDTFIAESGLKYKVKGVYTPGVTIADDQSRPFYLDSYNITLESNANTSSDTKFLLGTVLSNSGNLTITDSRTQIHLLKEGDLVELTKAYTTSQTFKVGGSSGKYVLTEDYLTEINKDWTSSAIFKVGGENGVRVLTEADVSKSVINSSILSSSIPNFKLINVSPLKYGERILLDFRWGFHGIQGHTTTTGFVITSGYDSATMDAIEGQFLHIPNHGNFVISGSHATSGGETIIDTLTPAEDYIFPSEQVTLTASNPGLIHTNALKYSFRAVPVIGGVEQSTGLIIQTFEYAGNIFDVNKTSIKLLNGITYNISVTVMRGTSVLTRNLPTGSYTKYSTTQNYTYPLVVTYPTLPNDGAVSIADAGNKIHLEIAGWADADDYEIVYTNTGEADFNNQQQPKVVSSNRMIDIIVTIRGSYKLKVRPRVAYQQVQTPIATSISIATQRDETPVQDTAGFYAQCVSYSGTISNVTEAGTYGGGAYTKWSCVLSSVKSPSGSGLDVLGGRRFIQGGYITDANGNTFWIIQGNYQITDNSATVDIVRLTGTAIPTAGNFTIGTDAKSRLIGTHYTSKSCRAEKYNVTAGYILGQVLIKIYNEKDPNTFDSILLDEASIDNTIEDYGNVLFNSGDKVIVTAYDSTGTKVGNYNVNVYITFGDR